MIGIYYQIPRKQLGQQTDGMPVILVHERREYLGRISGDVWQDINNHYRCNVRNLPEDWPYKRKLAIAVYWRQVTITGAGDESA